MSTISIPVTATFAGILGVVYTALNLNVVKVRFGSRVLIGDGSLELLREVAHKKEGTTVDFKKFNKLMSAVRAHANFIEYVPIQLILAALLELQGVDKLKLKVLLSVFTLSRLLHTTGITKSNFLGAGRPIGTFTTFGTILISAIANIYVSYPAFRK
ncbi:hypothetical protein PPL_04409 [Heterostelium album PN500]|uniref:Uncharacterized protein n=1 Tax=Heterostelium pallidum (strain ATCC 26659 / Pp 5 / PN500) TaxID=670386 RepID=D3B7H1_HETP5|nr:hypothetical protein PPL_04409 [Heterostelium album PN500]EFA82714.1 hypothetical protein PPL_04409 [Heterostelium album PN500]|eukprot:XP_020434831.1 hypothetical protein PPL_04409 [Heterostelium album PN500]